MKTSNINFTGIKNAGYCWINNNSEGHNCMKANLNAQLTSSDYKEYQKLLKKYPSYKNKFAPNFVNIELQSDSFESFRSLFMKLNGVLISPLEEDKPVWNFVQNVVNKIKKQSINDFKVNKDYIISDACHYGLVYDTDFNDVINAEIGTIGLFGDKPLPLKHHDDILKVLHTPVLVKGGANYFSEIINGVNKSLENKLS